MNGITAHLLLLGFCLAGAAFFAGIETGVVSINRLRLQHLVQRKVPAAKILEDFVRGPDLLLGTTLVGTNLCQVIVGVVAASMSARIHPYWGPVGSGVLVAGVLLVACEYLPKAWFQSYPIHRTLPLARTLRFSARLLRPISWTLSSLLRVLLPKTRDPDTDARPLVTREELIHLADEGRRSGSLTPDESRMIRNVIEIGGRKVGDIMIPRDRMLWIEAGKSAREALDLARQKNVKFLPVWNPDKNTFDRTVSIFDILIAPDIEGLPVSAFARPAQIVSIREAIEHIMPRMRVSRQSLMLVVDERFDVIGLITIEDVLREIVGTA
jgi:CBS domain containing-hemolysin-like protein